MNSGFTQLDLTFIKANRIIKKGDYDTPQLCCLPAVLAKRRRGWTDVTEVEDGLLDA